jgi:drug/metabolite transporter (DMT)-like permease
VNVGAPGHATLGDRAPPVVFAFLCLSVGGLYPFTKLALDGYDPFTLVVIRLAIGCALLACWACAQHIGLPRDGTTLAWLALAGVLNVTSAFLLMTWAQQHVSASFAAIVGGTQPIFTAVGAALLLSDERLTLRRALGILLGFAGIVVLLSRSVSWSDVLDGSDVVVATVALLLGALGLACVALLVRTRLRGLSAVQIALPMVLAGLPYMAVVTVLLGVTGAVEIEADVADTEATVSTAFLGLVNAGLGPILYYWLIITWGATRTALVGYAAPAVGVALSILLLHEHVSLEMAIGLALVLASFYWVSPITRPVAPVRSPVPLEP